MTAEEQIRAALEAGPTPGSVERLLRYAGQTMRTARNPCLTARQAIEVGNWLAELLAELDGLRKKNRELLRWKGIHAPRLEAKTGLLETAQVEAAKGAEAVSTLASEREANAILTDELTRERARSQMYADLVRAIAVVLHGPGYSDTSKLAQEVEALKAELDRLRAERKPLTEEQIRQMVVDLASTVGASHLTLTRAVERAHGITGD